MDAEIAAAAHRVTTLEQKIAKCMVAAPIDGTILRVYMRPGESFSTVMPRPLLAIADLSVRRVRAEVDERDVHRVRVGQRVQVFAETDSGRMYAGEVARLAASMGRKRVLSDEPAEPADRDVLEALIDLDRSGLALPVGLRVIVQFLK